MPSPVKQMGDPNVSFPPSMHVEDGKLPSGAAVKKAESSSSKTYLAGMSIAAITLLAIAVFGGLGAFAHSSTLPSWFNTAVDFTGKQAFGAAFVLGAFGAGALAINIYFVVTLPKENKVSKSDKNIPKTEVKSEEGKSKIVTDKTQTIEEEMSGSATSSRRSSIDPEFDLPTDENGFPLDAEGEIIFQSAE